MMPVIRHIYNYLQVLLIFTIFSDVGKEKISMNNFLLLLIIFVYPLNFYEYTLLLQTGK